MSTTAAFITAAVALPFIGGFHRFSYGYRYVTVRQAWAKHGRSLAGRRIVGADLSRLHHTAHLGEN